MSTRGLNEDEQAMTVVFSPDLPEPTQCIIGADGDCQNYLLQPELECTCKFFCGDSGGDAGCCYCQHTDVYEPCPRGGFWCDPECGDADPEFCCTLAQRAFKLAAHEASRPAPSPVVDASTSTGAGQ